ncbi:hypothetical protein Psuf_048360 [Phytohabitans suffuscus]|uniref:3-isopropylmalate dehydratase n=1 Tax=Phytohabitans suffuscus TaxID=624315 RepID=A0A6F8YNF3_9ACTN|nr:hypothetical protein Psuf_048360 [Phytohabitans suffuscus]
MVGDTQKPRTLAEKVWDAHVVRSAEGEPDLLFIDLHLLHEVTSPQAFDGLRMAGRSVRRTDLTLATEDHNTPTGYADPSYNSRRGDLLTIADPTSRTQIETLRRNCAEFGVKLHPLGDAQQGIVHVIGPQLGLTQPGLTIVCGDSHTATHGAFGALAFGIGTSEVEHVLATQTLPQARPKTMAVTVEGALRPGVTAKDLVLALIAKVGTGGGRGHVVEYRGDAIRALSMEGRMTICNMSIEWGAKAGMIAPDETTFAYLKGRPNAPQSEAWDAAVEHWRSLTTDEGATFDTEVVLDAAQISPFVTWGTNRGRASRSTAPCRTRRRSSKRSSVRPPAAPWSTWRWSPAPACATSRSTWSSSAPAPTAGWKTCAPRPRCCAATRSPTACACSWCPVPPRCARPPSTRGSTRCSRTRARSGGSPAAPCAWA